MINRKRILQVNIDNNGGNGAFSLIRYFSDLLKDDFIFDYFSMGKFVEDSVYEDIYKKGGACFSADLRKNRFLGHILLPLKFYIFLKNHKYEIIHIHGDLSYKFFLYLVPAKLAKVKTVIIHSHSTNIDGDKKKIKFLIHILTKYIVNVLGDKFLACSMDAAKWSFSKKNINSSNFCLLHNGINPYPYKFSENVRIEVRCNLNITDKIVLGHVGSLKPVKNQSRLLDIIQDINDPRFVLILVGDGSDLNKLKIYCKEKHIEDRVLFLGNRTDVCNILQAMDIFVFPSFFEGMPMALVEAQSVGLPIIASDTINHDIKINNNVEFISLKETNEVWITKIQNLLKKHLKDEGYHNVESSNFNVSKNVSILKSTYTNGKN